ncbi:TolC family protein [uncultured Desulfuromonas sp.]|uniref:TolC family protein n=1 Tax=uncultured Desulfuromonas sp. TaxID=181013 RepID=UPI002AAC1696|nr:TolC family protein [uncultured Desulfuromonas sp.]
MFLCGNKVVAKRYHIWMRVLLLVLFCIIPRQGKAGTLEFNQLRREILAQAYDVKLAAKEIDISQQRIREAGAAYFPALSFRYSNEWFKDFTESSGGLDSVGGTVISSSGSKWKNVATLSLNYTLYDFGTRSLRVDSAKLETEQTRRQKEQREQDVSLQVLDLFARGWRLQTQQNIQQQRLELAEERYALGQRLYQAGTMDRIKVGELAIDVAETRLLVEQLQRQFVDVLWALTELSGHCYEPTTTFVPLGASDAASVTIALLPEVQALDLAIETKQNEVDMALRRFLPTLNLYSSYTFYGRDSSDWSQAFSDLDDTNFSCGITLDVNLFNGFGDLAQFERLKLEKEHLQLQREKKVAELTTRYQTLKYRADQSPDKKQRWSHTRRTLEEQRDMMTRLSQQQLRDQVTQIGQQLDLLEQQLQVRLDEIEQMTALNQLTLLSAYQFRPDF